MSYINAREKELKEMITPQNMNEDFESFWVSEVEKMRAVPLKVERKKLKTPYDKIFNTYEIAYNTHYNTIVHASNSAPYPKGGIKTSSPPNYRTVLAVRRYW